MKERITIGLMGLNFNSDNLGCSALAISFYYGLIDLLDRLGVESKLIAIGVPPQSFVIAKSEDYPIDFVEYHLSKICTIRNAKQALKSCDVVFDFTEGDSFSDIYGRSRFYRSIVLKIAVEKAKVPLVLGPQTYGPFEKRDCMRFAKQIVNKAYKVYSRDEESKDYLEKNGVEREVITSTDVAFRLPYTKDDSIDSDKKIRVGVNVSGLLWRNAMSEKKTLELVVNYIEYCRGVINQLCDDDRYQIYLISHVGKGVDSGESDHAACSQLAKEYPQTILLDSFLDPVSAKSAIAKMDVLIAARMHASIAGFSSGVFTIPFAYSRKFRGYYHHLSYPVLIDGQKDSTDDAIEKTMAYIEKYQESSENIKKCQSIAETSLSSFYDSIFEILKEIVAQ